MSISSIEVVALRKSVIGTYNSIKGVSEADEEDSSGIVDEEQRGLFVTQKLLQGLNVAQWPRCADAYKCATRHHVQCLLCLLRSCRPVFMQFTPVLYTSIDLD